MERRGESAAVVVQCRCLPGRRVVPPRTRSSLQAPVDLKEPDFMHFPRGIPRRSPRPAGSNLRKPCLTGSYAGYFSIPV